MHPLAVPAPPVRPPGRRPRRPPGNGAASWRKYHDAFAAGIRHRGKLAGALALHWGSARRTCRSLTHVPRLRSARRPFWQITGTQVLLYIGANCFPMPGASRKRAVLPRLLAALRRLSDDRHAHLAAGVILSHDRTGLHRRGGRARDAAPRRGMNGRPPTEKRKQKRQFSSGTAAFWCRRRGSNPHGAATEDFKSLASACSPRRHAPSHRTTAANTCQAQEIRRRRAPRSAPRARTSSDLFGNHAAPPIPDTHLLHPAGKFDKIINYFL